MAEALADIERFTAPFDVLEDGPEVSARLDELCRRVATVLAHGETRALSANRSDFRRLEPRIEVVGL